MFTVSNRNVKKTRISNNVHKTFNNNQNNNLNGVLSVIDSFFDIQRTNLFYKESLIQLRSFAGDRRPPEKGIVFESNISIYLHAGKHCAALNAVRRANRTFALLSGNNFIAKICTKFWTVDRFLAISLLYEPNLAS